MKRTREEAEHGGNEAAEGEKPQAKRGRKVIDYEAFRKEPHLRPIWTKALSRVASKGNSASIRVEVEKGLEALFRKVLRQLESKKSLLDPLEARQAQSTLRDKELEEEEKRLSAHVELEEEELANLTKANLQNRNDLRLIANLAVDPVDVDRLLASTPPVDRPHVRLPAPLPSNALSRSNGCGARRSNLTKRRKRVSPSCEGRPARRSHSSWAQPPVWVMRPATSSVVHALFTLCPIAVEFDCWSPAHLCLRARACTEGKLSRLLAVWRQRAESTAGDTTDHPPAGTSA
jgi:hypothetical protein